jgi:hypothetical protein
LPKEGKTGKVEHLDLTQGAMSLDIARHSSDRAFEQDLIDLLDIGLGNALIASQRN